MFRMLGISNPDMRSDVVFDSIPPTIPIQPLRLLEGWEHFHSVKGHRDKKAKFL